MAIILQLPLCLAPSRVHLSFLCLRMPLLRGKVRQGVLKVQVRKVPRRQAKEPQVQVPKVPLQWRVLRPLNSVCAVASTATGHLNALYLPMPRRPPLVLRPRLEARCP